MEITEPTIQLKGQLCIEIRDAKTGKLKSRDVYKNMVVTLGKNGIAQALSGVANVGEITYCAVGTLAVAPALADTILGAEIGRNQVSVRSVSGNIATFQTYFGTQDANGSLKEAGLFGDTATAQPASGILYAHAAINRTKTVNDTLTITWTIQVG